MSYRTADIFFISDGFELIISLKQFQKKKILRCVVLSFDTDGEIDFSVRGISYFKIPLSLIHVFIIWGFYTNYKWDYNEINF